MSNNNNLKMIQKVVNTEMNKRKQLEYNNTIKVFDITKKFIKDNGLMLYGGAALNALVKKKFYKKYDLPDYDFLSPNAQKHSMELANLYAKEGYEYTESKPGTHFGTYKVFASFVPVADITQIPLALFKKMKKTAVYVKELDVFTVPVDYLRMAIYIELSRPAGDISRWAKIYERLQLFNKYYPIDIPKKQLYINNNEFDFKMNQILNVIKEYIIFKKLVIFGAYAMSLFLPKNNVQFPKISKNMSYIDALSINAKDTIFELRLILKNIGFHIDSTQQNVTAVKLAGSRAVVKRSGLSSKEFFGEHYSLTYKNTLLINVFQTEACYSYFNHNNMRIASIDTMLSFYYAFLFSTRTYIDVTKIKIMIEHLFNLQNKNKLKKNIKYTRFGLTCYGKQKFLKNLKIEKYNRMKTKSSNMKVHRPKVKASKKQFKEVIYL